MKTIVVDVAAEYGGALSILNEFRSEFEIEKDNEYIVLLGKLKFDDTSNIKYKTIPWVKRSYLHRLFFDQFYVRRIINKEKPDRVLSLQNKSVCSAGVKQIVYFHNALFICEKRYSLSESKKLWLYQNVISIITRNSLKRANAVIVQAQWIKDALVDKWSINEKSIIVKPPHINLDYWTCKRKDTNNCDLFYPAGYDAYKNHERLIEACVSIWQETGMDNGLTLSLTIREDSLSDSCKRLIDDNNYPIHFLGRQRIDQMKELYKKTDLIFPSFIETVGLPLAEAKCMGCFIIASDCNYSHETIGDYDKILFFNPYEVESIKKSIKDYMVIKKND